MEHIDEAFWRLDRGGLSPAILVCERNAIAGSPKSVAALVLTYKHLNTMAEVLCQSDTLPEVIDAHRWIPISFAATTTEALRDLDKRLQEFGSAILVDRRAVLVEEVLVSERFLTVDDGLIDIAAIIARANLLNLQLG